jgi:sporulation protein YlmC with PRC-barrel domain
MATHKLPLIEVGYQVFTSDGGEEVGAVRQVVPNDQPEIVVYIENTGDFSIPLSSVTAVHSHKVIVDLAKLDPRIQVAIGRAHDNEKSRS